MPEKKRRKIPVRPRLDDDFDDDDLVGPRTREGAEAPPPRAGRSFIPQRAARRGGERDLLKMLVRDVPAFLKLLWGLLRDPRVSKADKAIVGAAVAYIALPADLIPDWIPGLGEVEDVFLLALALSRLLVHAGEDVLMDHWDGDEETLEQLLSLLEDATAFLPAPVRRILGPRD